MQKYLKSNKGITLMTLTLTIVVMMILTFTVSININTYIERNNRINLETDIIKLKEEIDYYYSKNKELPIINKYTNTQMLQKNISDNENYYVIDLKELQKEELNYGKDYYKIDNKDENIFDFLDVYIINEQSHTIYYPKGVKYNNEIIYTTMSLGKIELGEIPISKIEIIGKTVGTINDTIQLKANIIPEFVKNEGVNWSSSNENIAIIDEQGNVNLKQIGEVTITATLKENAEVTQTHTIEVIEQFTDFYHKENLQEYVVPVSGTYKIECWGAQNESNNKKGAYTTGNIELEKGTILYVYVGEKISEIQENTGSDENIQTPAFKEIRKNETDIRVLNGEWNNDESLISRIMIATEEKDNSFISGLEGCNAVDANGNYTNGPYHYSGYIFKNAKIIAENELMPNKEDRDDTLGNSGDGYVRISFVK